MLFTTVQILAERTAFAIRLNSFVVWVPVKIHNGGRLLHQRPSLKTLGYQKGFTSGFELLRSFL